MTDTQWPRYIVFQQDKDDQPHHYVGSVHAPDAEMALMNARDVFVRRPACVSLWVAPADMIFAMTAEQLRSGSPEHDSHHLLQQQIQPYRVFQKAAHKGTYVHVGDVMADTARSALTAAFDSVASRAALAWWVLPASMLTHTTPEDVDALFRPALSKDFRDQAFFHTVAAMQQIKAQTQDTSVDEP